MRKNIKTLGWLILMSMMLICLLTGCSSGGSKRTAEEEQEEGSYRIYYTNLEKTSLVTHAFKPESADFDGILQEVLTAFKTADTSDVLSALPEQVTINSTTTGINEIDVDFNTEYLSLDTITEILLRGALVRTLLQLPGVDIIRFTVDSQALRIGDKEVGPMTEHTFIVPTEDSINSYRNVPLTLYFPSEQDNLLHRETRTVYYSSNVNTERLVIEQMLEGPRKNGMLPVAVEGSMIRDIVVSNNICTVDFTEEINNAPPSENVTDPETILYAFTNSVIDSCLGENITGVRFKVDGSSEGRFRNQVNLDQTFNRNIDLIASGNSDAAESEWDLAAEVAPVQEEAPAEEAPVQEEAPAEEAPAQEEAPAEEVPAQEGAPAEEAPAQEEAPAEEAPAQEEAPAEEAPAQEEAPAPEEAALAEGAGG